MGCLQLSYYEDLTGFTEVSRLKICYVNPKLRAENNTSFLGVVLEGVKGAGNSSGLNNVQAGLTAVGAGLHYGESTLSYGANAPTGNVGGKILAKELAAGKYFAKGAKVLGAGAKRLPYVGLAVSATQFGVGQQSFGGLLYDGTMFGIGFIPLVGVPLSITGSVYKNEIMQWGSNLPKVDVSNEFICFVAGTPVFRQGQFINIEELNQNDSVSSYNFDNQLSELKIVNYTNAKQSINIYEIITSVDTFMVTGEHPFYVEGKQWVKAKDLKLEDELKNISGAKIVVVAVEKLTIEKEVYNIEVDGNHNFYVGKGKVLVHNKTINKEHISIEELNNELLENDRKK